MEIRAQMAPPLRARKLPHSQTAGGTGDRFEPTPPEQPDPRPWSRVQRASTQLKKGSDGICTVDNVRFGFEENGPANDWKGIFQNANLDPTKVKHVYLGLKPFEPVALAAHSVLYFEMEDDHPVVGADGKTDKGLVLSMEAHLHDGEQYAISKTLSGKYGVVYQLGTFKDLVAKTTRKEAHEQFLYKLDLDPAQKVQLLQNTLEAAVANRPEERYNLFTNSCHSVVIDLVNGVIPKSQRIHRWLLPHIYNPFCAFPPYGDFVFAGHHLLAHEARRAVQPDVTLHPGTQKSQSPLANKLNRLSDNGIWNPAWGLAGSALGAALTSTIHSLPPLVALPLGAAGGAYLAWTAAEAVQRRSNTVYESSEQHLK